MVYTFSDRFKRTPQPDANLGPMPEGGSGGTGVEVPNGAHQQMQAYWSVIDAVRGGTAEIRLRGEDFLSKEPFEKDAAYDRRRHRSCFTPWYARLVRGLVGMVLRKPITLQDVSDQVKSHLDNVNLLGDDLNTFAHEVFESAIDHGYTGIFVDYPRTDGVQLRSEEVAMGARPYWVHYSAPEIIGFRFEIQQNLRRFTQVRIKEKAIEPEGEFGEREVERIKVYDLVGGRCRYRSFVKDKDKYQLDPDSVGFLSLPFIPFVFVSTNKKKDLAAQPPMLELAYLNIKHYQLSSDLDHSLHIAAHPKLVLYGYVGDDNITIGADEALIFENTEGRAEWLTCSIESFEAQQQRIDKVEGQMAILGLSTLVSQKNVGESAEAKKLDRVQGDSIMSVIAQGLQDAFDLCLEYHAAYLNEEPGTCQVNRDFAAGLTPQMVEAYSKMHSANQISLETLLNLLKKGEVLDDEFSIEEEIARLEAEFQRQSQPNLPSIEDEDF